jgi:WD40 repeat protein
MGILCVNSSPLTPAGDGPVLLATGCVDGSVGLWAVKGKDCIARCFTRAHGAPVSRCVCARA